MARARSSGPAVYVWSLLFLGTGFLIFMVLFIMFLLRVEKAESTARDAKTKLLQFATSQEQNDPRVVEIGANPSGGTVVGTLLAENEELKRRITGNGEMTLEEIGNRLQELAVTTDLVGEFGTLQSNLDSAIVRLKDEEADHAETKTQRKRTEETLGVLKTEYSQSVQTLTDSQAALQQDFVGFQSKVGDQAAELGALLQDVRDASRQREIELESLLAQAKQAGARQTRRIQQLTDDLSERRGPGGVDISTVPDGKVALVVSQLGLVHINIGQAKHVLPGMTFEVYDSATGPVKNEFDEYRGKATIEVIRVLEEASVARIVRQPARGRDVLAGDVVANVVYDPDMVLKFFIYGDFDVDGKGLATDAGRRRVELMVLNWGGELSSSYEAGGVPKPINYDVDFLVLGEQPKVPQEPDADEVDPRIEEAYVAAKRRYETYNGLVMEAKELSIPILNQNRFLAMTGYYKR